MNQNDLNIAKSYI